MKKFVSKILLLLVFTVVAKSDYLQTGADSLISAPDALKGKKFAICMNHSSILKDGKLLLDSLISLGIKPEYIFSPEHGFPGLAGAGEKIGNSSYRGIPVISLYGKSKKPPREKVEELDIIIYDIQDVGLRFYTYISTLKNLALVCYESDKELWILDRPNPLGGEVVEGGILDDDYHSFVGSWPTPIRYGLTPAELLLAGTGEGWIPDVKHRIFPLKGWRRSDFFSDWEKPWIAPSPNLPAWENLKAYSGLCLLEGTIISEGRGTDSPFLLFGYPDSSIWSADTDMCDIELEKIIFTPVSLPAAKYPKYRDKKCYGFKIASEVPEQGMLYKTYYWIDELYKALPEQKEQFFLKTSSSGKYFIDLLYGSTDLRETVIKREDPGRLIKKDREESEKFIKKIKKYWLYR